MTPDALNAAHESKKAWDAGDYKAASRALSKAQELAPEETFTQAGDGNVLRKGEKGLESVT